MNIKLSTKLIGGFCITALITLIVGFMGWRGVSHTADALKEVSTNRLPSIIGLNLINEAQTAIQRAERSLLVPEIFRDENEKAGQLKRIDDAWKRVATGLKIYEPLPQTKEEEAK